MSRSGRRSSCGDVGLCALLAWLRTRRTAVVASSSPPAMGASVEGVWPNISVLAPKNTVPLSAPW